MIKTLHEILKASPDMTYNKAVKIQENMKLAVENKTAGVCVTAELKKDREIDYHRYWKDRYQKEHILRQEIEIKNVTLTKNRSLNTMDEIAYHELEYKIKNLEDENDNLRDKLQLKELIQIKELQTTTNK